MTSFDVLYDRDTTAYGLKACPELQAVLNQGLVQGSCLDLGAGAGRDALAMARHGLHVTAIDTSRRGIERLHRLADCEELEHLIDARVADVSELCWAEQEYGLINAVTLLDHLDCPSIDHVWRAMCGALSAKGIINVQVHTVADPGCAEVAGPMDEASVSESAGYVRHYFEPNELLEMANGCLSVLRYEQRLERDNTHDRMHVHSKATLLATHPKSRP